ncbi:MAG: sulfatase [Candidatus Nanohalobium sp.]
MTEPNIFLIVLDSTRHEYLGVYDNEARTPNIDDLAEKGLTFDNAFAPSGWTPPSHASMFTGKRPTDVGGTSPEPEIKSGTETIASRLSEKGYRTAAYHTAAHISKEAGYSQGFDKYKDVRHEYPRKKTLNPFMWADTMLQRIWGRKDRELFLTYLLNREIKTSEEPLFVFTNYQTPHRPYAPHFLAKSRFGNTEVSAEIQQLIDDGKEELGRKASNGEIDISEEDREALLNLGRAETYRVDFYIGRLVKKLKKEDMYENSVLIITADHGDNFGENGLFEHGYLSKENLHVPLIISGGFIEAQDRIEETVSTKNLKQFIEEGPEDQEKALDSLKTEYAVSELGESSIAQKHDFPWLDASISVTDGENQLLKRKNFEDISGKFTERGVDYNEDIPEEKKKRMEKEAGGFENFQAAGRDFNNFDDEEVKSKLADLGYT